MLHPADIQQYKPIDIVMLISGKLNGTKPTGMELVAVDMSHGNGVNAEIFAEGIRRMENEFTIFKGYRVIDLQFRMVIHADELGKIVSLKQYDLIHTAGRIILSSLVPDDILYIEAAGNYMTFCTKEKKVMSLLTMKEVLDILPTGRFVRIHKSYIIALKHIEAIDKHDVIIAGKAIPIGITYREKVTRLIRE